MKNNITCKVLVLLVISFVLFACAPKAPKVVPIPELSVQEQEVLAMQEFNSMLEATSTVPRRESRQVVEDGYNKIITKYPDSFRAEESHYRLMRLYLFDSSIPRVKEAEAIYSNYFMKYKFPKMDRAMNYELALFYFEYGFWNKLAIFCRPFLVDYIKTKNAEDSLYLFYYSEAKYNLKDYIEARKGYRMLLNDMPFLPNADLIKVRLIDIERLLDEIKKSKAK